uniref:Uncharacterized protein n=1 Tax=Pseudonaja textilis TaxID=8673 RepID=A0A670ZMT4_PSETE
MATYAGKQSKRQDKSSLGSLVDLVLANARVFLGVSSAALLALAMLVVKRFIDRPTSPLGNDDNIKAEQKQDLKEPLLSPVTAAPRLLTFCIKNNNWSLILLGLTWFYSFFISVEGSL